MSSIYEQGYFRDGTKIFYEKTMSDRVVLISFWLDPIHKLFKYGVQFAVRWILRSLGSIFFPNGPSKFQMAHQNLNFCMQMNGTWAIFMAYPYSGPEITLYECLN